jgi:hypothetical protein
VDDDLPAKPVPAKPTPVAGGSRLDKKPAAIPAAVVQPIAAAALPDTDEEAPDSGSSQSYRRRQYSEPEAKKNPTKKKVP